MSEWKDGTSYLQGDKDRVPRVWTLSTAEWRLSVHHYYATSGWCWSCHEVAVVTRQLHSVDADAAKVEAVDALRATLQRMVDALPIIDAQNPIEAAMLAWVRETYARAPAEAGVLPAVRAACKMTGCNLREAKDTLDALLDRGALRHAPGAEWTHVVPGEGA